ncbi:MAG: Hpt domain-containing protein [Spirochaetaceae bacterium]|jgi:HPt (histidine-containing phosphotransfer) domain-containing protein|nr:Hpt domain-containing protein [Spirochaetaceae bacterium]
MQDGIVYVDQAEGLKRVMQNTKVYVKILQKFKTDFKSKPDELIAAVGAADYGSAQILAHTLKGTAANLALTELYKQSLEVETQIKGGAVRPESLQNIKTCFNDTLLSIDTVLKQYG